MSSIIYVGMDVHTTNFTFCCYELGKDKSFGRNQVQNADYKSVISYLNKIKIGRNEDDIHFVCGYEAGCFGYSLYNQIMTADTDLDIECRIVAPSTLSVQNGKRVKTDKRDAEIIARNMCYNSCKYVHVPTAEDNAVKEYIRMRDDEKLRLKSIKQQIIAFCTRLGKQFSETKCYWTKKHREWLKKLDFGNALLRDTLDEYLISLSQSEEKMARYDAKIEEMAAGERYAEKVNKLCCIKGISTHTALSLLAEISDFNRFSNANKFAAYLGLAPGEHSSGDHVVHTSITKAGNSHLRRLLVECSQGYGRGSKSQKSKVLKARHATVDSKVSAYADKARIRMMSKFTRIEQKSGYNIAKVAIAREMACFVWGLMTDNIA